MYCIITDEEAVHFAPYSAPILHFATLGSFAFARYHNILGLPSFLNRPFVEGFRALVEAHVEEVRREEAAEGADFDEPTESEWSSEVQLLEVSMAWSRG